MTRLYEKGSVYDCYRHQFLLPGLVDICSSFVLVKFLILQSSCF